MTQFGRIPFVFRTSRQAWLNLFIGVVLAVAGVAIAFIATSDPVDPFLVFCSVVFFLVAALAFVLGVGSLLGQ